MDSSLNQQREKGGCPPSHQINGNRQLHSLVYSYTYIYIYIFTYIYSSWCVCINKQCTYLDEVSLSFPILSFSLFFFLFRALSVIVYLYHHINFEFINALLLIVSSCIKISCFLLYVSMFGNRFIQYVFL